MYTNPLRVLDSKNPEVQALLNDAPALGDYLDEESREHFAGRADCSRARGLLAPQRVSGAWFWITTTVPFSSG